MKTTVKQAVRRQNPMTVLRFVRALPQNFRLFLRLLGDRRVHWGPKAVLLAAVVYVLSPYDFLPDLIPVLGAMDDLTLVAFACKAFLRMIPEALVNEHSATQEN